LIGPDRAAAGTERFAAVLHYTMIRAPSFSLRGGTCEIFAGSLRAGSGCADPLAVGERPAA
jgi:hypothetical protein